MFSELTVIIIRGITCAVLPDGSPCAAETGRCVQHECCTGCVENGACVDGTQLTACGQGGNECTSCDDGNECTNDACVVWNAPGYPQCGHTGYSNQMLCAEGHGHCDGLGACCTGCFEQTPDGPICASQCISGAVCDGPWGMCCSVMGGCP